jgi:hypothetical protein
MVDAVTNTSAVQTRIFSHSLPVCWHCPLNSDDRPIVTRIIFLLHWCHVRNNDDLCSGFWWIDGVKSTEIHKKNDTSITTFLDFIHSLVFRTEHRSLSIITWKGGELSFVLSKVLFPVIERLGTDLTD